MLRGVAALLVIVAHYVELHLYLPEIAASSVFADPASVEAPRLLRTLILRPLNAGGLGVSLFFLLSGFVIPFSLSRYGVKSFAVTRFFRLYPTYVAAFAITCAALVVSSRYWGRPLPFNAGDYLANALLVPDLFARPTVLGVIWTLEVELKFYLVAALLARPILRGELWPMFAWGAGVVAFYAATTLPCAGKGDACLMEYGLFYAFTTWQGMYVTYLFVGTIFFAHFTGAVSTKRAALAVVAQVGLFAAAWPLSGFYAARISNPIGSYLLALAIFTACYAYRSHIRLTPLTRFFAEISYPLYAVHMLVGLSALRILSDRGVPYLVALPLVTTAVIAIARALHIYVEAPGMALGKKLAARLAQPK